MVQEIPGLGLVPIFEELGIDVPDFLDEVGEKTEYGEKSSDGFDFTLAHFEQSGMTRAETLSAIRRIFEMSKLVNDIELCLNLDAEYYGD